jgi:SpoVK/Ycf46/Vps4 family AAA+-type ATPase
VQAGYNAEYFSCADLAALLAEAQLAAVHELLHAEKAARQGEDESGTAATRTKAAAHHQPVVIQRRHLEAALGSVRPSVPEAERDRLEAVYARFRQDREPAGASRAADKGKAKLVSWA